MKHFSLFIYLLFFTLQPVFAQKENNNWCFGHKAGLSFNTMPPYNFPTNADTYGATSASVSDSNGNLLFYTDGNTVWDKNNNAMPNGYNMNPNYFPGSNQLGFENIAIPDPGNSNRYYVFTTLITSGYNVNAPQNVTLWYNIIDMGLNGGLGDVVAGYRDIIIDTNVTIGLAAAGDGYCDKWIIAHQLSSNNFKSFPITATGIGSPVISATGSVISSNMGGNGYIDIKYTTLKTSADNKRIALCSSTQDSDVIASNIYVFNFDAITGIVDNPVLIDSSNNDSNNVFLPQFSPLEFSPDNSKLYYEKINYINSSDFYAFIFQVDLNLPTTTDIQNSKNIVGMDSSAQNMQLAPDNKIYFVNTFYSVQGYNLNALGTIQYPNNYGLSCGVVNDYIVYPDTAGLGSLCSRMPANHALISNSVYACSMPDTLTSAIAAGSHMWNTGATTASIIITQPGLYWVRALQTCGAWRVDTFHVLPYQSPTPIADTFSCNGAPITITLDDTIFHQWSDGTQGPAFTITQSGVYSVTSIQGKCVFNDTFRAAIYPPLNTKILPADTTICDETTTALITCRYNFGNYHWSTGDTGISISINAPGIYWLQSVTPCGTFSDTVNIGFCSPVIDTISISADTICTGQCINITALTHNYPQAYSWIFTGGSPDVYTGPTPPTVCYDSAGIYAIKLFISSPGGADSAQAQVVVMPQPQGSFADTLITVPYNTTLVLPPCAPALHTQWYHNDTLVVTDNYQDGALSIIAQDYQSVYKCVVNNAGCTDTCAYNITVTDIPNGVWLPGAFSPNNDGKDDYFHIITANPNIEVVELAVYDRYGQRIYYTNHNDNGWDGTYKGVQADIGAYFWYLRYKVIGSTTIYSKKGNVMLIR